MLPQVEPPLEVPPELLLVLLVLLLPPLEVSPASDSTGPESFTPASVGLLRVPPSEVEPPSFFFTTAPELELSPKSIAEGLSEHAATVAVKSTPTAARVRVKFIGL
jgi:hypothetical protein